MTEHKSPCKKEQMNFFLKDQTANIVGWWAIQYVLTSQLAVIAQKQPQTI